jgi:hypothetical protein
VVAQNWGLGRVLCDAGLIVLLDTQMIARSEISQTAPSATDGRKKFNSTTSDERDGKVAREKSTGSFLDLISPSVILQTQCAGLPGKLNAVSRTSQACDRDASTNQAPVAVGHRLRGVPRRDPCTLGPRTNRFSRTSPEMGTMLCSLVNVVEDGECGALCQHDWARFLTDS